MNAIKTTQGYLVLISRGERSSVRTTHRKRRGSRCSIRRYDLLYPSIDKAPAHHVPVGYAFADAGNLLPLQCAARRKKPFYAFVERPRRDRVKITGIATSEEAEAAIRLARQARDDAEWDASAPSA